MSNSVVMVTGGAGFIGSHLVEKLLNKGYETHVFDFLPLEKVDNLRNVKNNKNLHYFQGDLTKPDDIKHFWRSDASCVYHLAAVVGIKNYIADPLKLIDINVIGTRYLIEEAAKTKTRVLFTSTSEYFGRNPIVPWDETADRVLGSSSVDRWSYSSSKGVCEHMLYGMQKAAGLPFTIVRYFNAYGPRQNPYFLISQTVYKILRGEKPLMYDNGDMTRCFSFIDDEVEGTILAAEHPMAIGESFNLGNPIESSVKEVIETALRVSGNNLGYDVVNTDKLYGKHYEDIIRRIPKVEKAWEVLGWQAKTTLEEGLSRTFEWAKNNEWWLA